MIKHQPKNENEKVFDNIWEYNGESKFKKNLTQSIEESTYLKKDDYILICRGDLYYGKITINYNRKQ